MIYGICFTCKNKLVYDFKTNFSNNSFLKYMNKIVKNQRILCSINFYDILPDDIHDNCYIFSTDDNKNYSSYNSLGLGKKIVDNEKLIISSYGNNTNVDIYIYAASHQLISMFGNNFDVLIIYNNDNFESSIFSINECINFANFDLLKEKRFNRKSFYQYFIRNKNEFIGN